MIKNFLTLFFLVFFVSLTYAQKPQNSAYKFIENKGQWNKDIKFISEIPGGKIYLKNNKITYSLHSGSTGSPHHTHHQNTTKLSDNEKQTTKIRSVDISFLDANTHPAIEVLEESKEVYNYYLGKDPTKWASECRAYRSILYKEIYPDIDLKFYSNEYHLKYDVILKKGADPKRIKFKYNGTDNITLKNRNLYSQIDRNTIIENKPYAYQIDKKGTKTEVKCNYQLDGNELSFTFPEGYNRKQALVIDPELIFSTFSGSVADNFGYTACYDSLGNMYSGGIVFGNGFPNIDNSAFSGGSTDISILKFDSTGSQLLYATYIGGSSEDTPHSLIVNNKNELVILGTTGSNNYPVTANAYDKNFNGGTSFSLFDALNNGSDITVSKLDESGKLISSTFAGGTGNDGILKMTAIGDYTNQLIKNYGDYIRGDVIVDMEDNIYIASCTESTDFPITSNIQNTYNGGNSDAIIFKMDTDLSNMLWSTYLGGNQDDATYSIKLDPSNNIYVGGGTTSTDFPVSLNVINENHQGDIDGFITKIDPFADVIVNSTFAGTDKYDQVYFIDLDSDQNIYLFGQTSGQYPVSDGVYSNPNSSQFIHKIDNTLRTTLFSTVIGSGTSKSNISPTAFLVNDCNNIFLSGWGGDANITTYFNNTKTLGMPVSDDALFPATDGSDFYLMALSADGRKMLYGTFFGSTNIIGDHVDGGTSRFDKKGIIYQAACSCGGRADNFPTTPNAWSSINKGVDDMGNERCNNAAFKFDLATLEARLKTNSPDGSSPGLNDGCAPLEVLFLNKSVGGIEFFWDFGDGNTSKQKDSVINVFEKPGVYTVTLKARDENTCIVEDIDSGIITVYDSNFGIDEGSEICYGDQIQLNAFGGINYQWSTKGRQLAGNTSSPIVNPDTTTTYFVTVTDKNNCMFKDSIEITVVPEIITDFSINRIYNCQSLPIVELKNTTIGSETFQWDLGDGTTSKDASPVHQYSQPGSYIVTLNAENKDCQDQTATEITLGELLIPNIVTINDDDKNDKFILENDTPLPIIIFNRWGKKLYESDQYANNWPEKDVNPGVYYYEVNLPNGTPCNGWVHVVK